MQPPHVRIARYAGLILVCLAQLTPGIAGAQESGLPATRLAMGIGPGTVGGAGGASARVAFAVAHESGVYTLRLTTTEASGGWRIPSEITTGIGALYGREIRGQRGFLSGSAGLGYARGVRLGDAIEYPPTSCASFLECLATGVYLADKPLFERDRFRTIGIPVELEAGWTFFSWLGLGATAFADLNGGNSSYGAAVSVVLRR